MSAPGAAGAAGARFARLAAVALAAAVLVTWLPSLGASFQFDDWNVIVRDPRVQSLGAWLASMPGIRPLLKLSYAANHALGGDPAAFRALNVAVHALNAVLVLRLLTTLGRRLGWPAADAVLAAATGAIVFALHPVQTEAVTYVSGRSSSLSASLALLALLAWLRGLDAADEARWRWISFGLFVAALGVKEPVAVLPLAMAAWLVATRASASIPRRVAPHLLLVGGLALAMLAWPPYRAVLEGSLGARSIGVNLLTQVDAVHWLLGQLVRFDRLNADPALPALATLDAGLALRALLLVAAASTGLVLLWRGTAAGVAITWFFVWLLPTNSILPRLDVVNDRQLYLAIVGPGWLLGMGLAAVARRWRSPRSTKATTPGTAGATAPLAPSTGTGLVLLVLAAGLASATLARNRVYADEIVFWQDVARKSPHNARAANNLGYAYALDCRDAEALVEFARAMRLDPGDGRAPINHYLLTAGQLFAENQRRCTVDDDATR